MVGCPPTPARTPRRKGYTIASTRQVPRRGRRQSHPPRRAGPEDVALDQKIRALRLERGLSQEELGRAVGVTFQQVQKYERGANRVSAGRLQRIADALQVAVTFFYRAGESGKAHQETGFGDLKSRKLLRLARAFVAIPEAAARHAVVTLVERLEHLERRLRSR